MTLRSITTLATAAAAIGLLTGCAASNPLASGAGDGNSEAIVVGSANYPENILLGETYAQALEAAGFTVQRQLNIGAREVLYNQIKDCSLNVIAEYNQALLSFVSPDATASGTDKVNKALANALPEGLAVLDSSPAEDNNAIAVTGATANSLNLRTIADLASHAPEMVFGGPTEWEARAGGYPALQKSYGVEFKEYRVLDYSGPITLSALEKDDVQAAVLFSTTPQIETAGHVILEDPENALGVNNVIPLVCEDKVPAEARNTLNKISSAMTTEELTAMNAAYSIDKKNAEDVAKEWLENNGLK